MTTSRRHHYLPQVHLNKFKSENGFHLFRKTGNTFISKKNTSDIFQVTDLNTTVNENGVLDHDTVEEELTLKWDNAFNTHYNNIMNYIADCISNKSENPIIIQESINFFFEYSIVAFLRSKKSQRKNDISDFDWVDGIDDFKEIISNIDSKEYEKGVAWIFENIDKTKDWVEKLKELKFPSMTTTNVDFLRPSSCSCDIIISMEQPFLLPDCTSIITLSNEKIIFNNKVISKIYCVGVPITPYVFLQIKNNDLCGDKSTYIYKWNSERVNELNFVLFNKAFDQILYMEKVKVLLKI